MLNKNEREHIAKLYDATCKSFDKILEPEVLKMQIEDLSDLHFEKIIEALHKYRLDKKNNFWPKANKIRDIILPEQTPETMANEAASRIRYAISTFGWTNPQKAREYIGELGWRVVERSGGWMYLCENHGVELSPLTYHAQARDLAKSICESEKLGLGDQPIGLPSPENKNQIQKITNLISMKEIPK